MKTERKTLHLLAKAPDSKGVFDGEILHNPADGDADGERIDSWSNLPTTVPLGYSHTYSDPGAMIGKARVVLLDFRHLSVKGQLDLSRPMAVAVHERMLLSSDDPMVLNELSVGFSYDPAQNTKDANGVVTIHDAVLEEVSVVHRGAQATTVCNVKDTTRISLPDFLVAVARQSGVQDLGLLQRIRWSAEDLGDRPDLLKQDLEMLIDNCTRQPDPVLQDLNAKLDALERPTRKTSDPALSEQVDDFVAAVQLEMVEEKLAEARAARLDAELDASAAHVGPVPEFDERFVVGSVPTEHEPGDTERVQVVDYQNETFRVAVIPRTMRPDDE